jgi:hypothetical protein
MRLRFGGIDVLAVVEVGNTVGPILDWVWKGIHSIEIRAVEAAGVQAGLISRLLDGKGVDGGHESPEFVAEGVLDVIVGVRRFVLLSEVFIVKAFGCHL